MSTQCIEGSYTVLCRLIQAVELRFLCGDLVGDILASK